MMKAYEILLIALVVFPFIVAEATDVEGDVWGTWTKENSPYNVIGEIRVPPESTLVIEPGVFVNFQGHYKFIVDSLATLSAVGAETDSIYFTTEDPVTGWHGLRFLSADSNSQLSYCRLEHGRARGSGQDARGAVIYCYCSTVLISNNTITLNWAKDGGAIFCDSSSPTIRDNTISLNAADSCGGAIYCADRSSPTVSGNLISDNMAFGAYGGGGGIYCHSSNPTIADNVISDNMASGEYWPYAYGDGGGICCYRSSPTLSNNTFAGNSAHDRGGAICCDSLSSPAITGNTMTANSAWDGAGIFCIGYCASLIRNNSIRGNHGEGIYCDSLSVPGIRENEISDNSDCGISCFYSNAMIHSNTISGNSGGSYGGGIYCQWSSPFIVDNLIVGNSATHGGGIGCRYYSDPEISDNTISGCSAVWGGGIWCTTLDSRIANNTITECRSEFDGGAIYCAYATSSLHIENNVICGNEAGGRGGGLFCYWAYPIISSNRICSNRGIYGGGVACYNPFFPYFPSPTMTNNVIATNLAAEGGGIYCIDSSPMICNNTISRNSGTSTGGGISCHWYCSPTIINTILWGDTAPNGPEIFLIDNCSPTITYSDVAGGWEGEGNIDIDPLFRDPENGDFHLMADYCGDPDNSPCIDAGSRSIVDSYTDCFHGLGARRSDMGAYGGENSGWPTGIEDEESGLPIPKQFLLLQNYPNPFNATTVIDYQVPLNGYVKLEIYNMLGQKLATLVDSKQHAAYRSVIWDASEASSGLYFYKLTVGDWSGTKKMTLVK